MKLGDIIYGYPVISTRGGLDLDIAAIEHNSKKLGKDSLFLAQRGYTVDGHNYIGQAIEKGARAIVSERDLEFNGHHRDIRHIKVENSGDALAYISDRFYNSPWRKMNLIGVTGTNGKTTITYYLNHIFETNKNKSAIVGSIGSLIDGNYIDLPNTTPDALEIEKLLDKMARSGIQYSSMEVSSHALDMGRVKYINYDVGIFTNLSQDHLDYHKNMEDYFNAKLGLFYKIERANIINIDDDYGKRIVQTIKPKSRGKIISYAINEKADVYASDINFEENKLSFKLRAKGINERIHLRAPAKYNIYNCLAASACGLEYGISPSIIKEAFETMPMVKGRFELVPNNRGYNIIIDSAHTPDAIKNTLQAIDKFTAARKIIVFGAGGDRDKAKRPQMGKIASQYADLLIVTSDNPRSENPSKIIDDIVQGIEKRNGNYIRIEDRREAIAYALSVAKSQDTILLAGKGHEEYTICATRKIPFNEREIIREILENL